MVEIKLKPGMKFKYKDIDFICLDIINGNYLAITAISTHTLTWSVTQLHCSRM